MISIGQIEALAGSIVREFNPDKVVLFGSYAEGSATPDSDVDMLVVLPFEGSNLDKSVEILVRTAPTFPIDLMARKPEDTARRYEAGDPFIKAALDRGRILHARAD